jgi:hypothetical protein
VFGDGSGLPNGLFKQTTRAKASDHKIVGSDRSRQPIS